MFVCFVFELAWMLLLCRFVGSVLGFGIGFFVGIEVRERRGSKLLIAWWLPWWLLLFVVVFVFSTPWW